MKRIIILTCSMVFIYHVTCFSQGLNRNFLIGYSTSIDTNVISNRGIINFNDTSVSILPDSFVMAFDGAQANISNEFGNLLMFTNGCSISDASGNTMQNGDSLNPGLFVDSYCSSVSGLPNPNSSVFLPWPDDTTKYILFHQTGSASNPTVSSELFYSTIDITQNGGLGAVTQKNVIALQTTLCPAIVVCKHANGRDWWIVVITPSNIIYKLLLTPSGIINTTSQTSGFNLPNDLVGQIKFSPDGTKLAYYFNYYVGSVRHHELRILDFDRCSGMFTNPRIVSYTTLTGGYCTAFSPNSKYLYFGTFNTLFQVNTDTSNVVASLDTIAIKDNYCYPYNFLCTDFWYGYLAANGKIYVTSGSSVIDLHYINEPDSEGIACDMRLHSLRMPCYTGRGNVYHPNYYLGPVIGSACDTLAHVGIYELEGVKNVTLKPNPSYNGDFSVSYMLPQNKSGILIVNDMMGKQVFEMSLPPWSSLQDLSLSGLKSGVYSVTIQSENTRMSKRLVVIH